MMLRFFAIMLMVSSVLSAGDLEPRRVATKAEIKGSGLCLYDGEKIIYSCYISPHHANLEEIKDIGEKKNIDVSAITEIIFKPTSNK